MVHMHNDILIYAMFMHLCIFFIPQMYTNVKSLVVLMVSAPTCKMATDATVRQDGRAKLVKVPCFLYFYL